MATTEEIEIETLQSVNIIKEDNFLEEPTHEELIEERKNAPAIMKITFTSVEQLQKAEIDIQEILDRKYNGAYFSVSANEL